MVVAAATSLLPDILAMMSIFLKPNIDRHRMKGIAWKSRLKKLSG